MSGPAFGERLRQELEERRKKNPRYSIRAFAAVLDVDHSTLSQVMRGKRRVPVANIRTWAKKLKMSPEEAAAYMAAEHVPDAATAAREHQLRHWTAEALALVAGAVHWGIVSQSRIPGFQADSRWVARQLGVSVDEVNVAFTRLLRLELMTTTPAGEWLDTLGPSARTKEDFLKLALARVRKKAAEHQIKLTGRRQWPIQ